MPKFSIDPDSSVSVTAKVIAGAVFIGVAAGLAIHAALTIARSLPCEWSAISRSIVVSVSGIGALIAPILLVDFVVSLVARKRWTFLRALSTTHARFDAMMKAGRATKRHKDTDA